MLSLTAPSVLYLCEGDGVDRSFCILSPRCLTDHPSPQQRDTRSLSAFQKLYMGVRLKKLRTYVPTNKPRQSHLQMALSGFCLQADYLVRRLEEALLRLPLSK